MLETPDAVARADEIASVPGLDMVMMGPHDLTAEMGILGQFRDEAFLDAVRTVAKACRAHGTIFGIAGIRDLELLTEFVELGPALRERRHRRRLHDRGRGRARGRGCGRIPVEGRRMSTTIHTEQVHDPMAWVGADFASDDDLVYRLTPATVQGLEEILERVRDIAARLDRARARRSSRRRRPGARGLRGAHPRPRPRGRARLPGGGAHDRGERASSTGAWLSHFGDAAVEQLVRSPDGAGAAGGAARRRAAGARHEVGRRARDAQRLRRHLLAAVDPPGRAGRGEPVLERSGGAQHDPGHAPRRPADPVPRVPAPPPERAARRPTRRDALRRADLLQRRRPDLHQLHLQQHPACAARARAAS